MGLYALSLFEHINYFFGLKWGVKFPKNGKNSTKILNLRQGMTDGWVSKVYQSKYTLESPVCYHNGIQQLPQIFNLTETCVVTL